MKNNRKIKPSFDDLFDGIQSIPVSPTEEKIIGDFLQTHQKKTKRQKRQKSKRSKIM